MSSCDFVLRPGGQRISLDSLLRDKIFFVPLWGGPHKQIWVLGRAGYNLSQGTGFDKLGCTTILFLLALSTIWLDSLSILVRSKFFLGTQCIRIRKCLRFQWRSWR